MSTLLDCTSLDGGIGAGISNLNLRRPLECAEATEFRDLFAAYGLLVLRDQWLTQEQQVRVMSYLGPVVDPNRELAYITNKAGVWGGVVQTSELCFHSDHAALPEPDLAFSLHAIEVVDDTTTTRFASGTRALGALSREVRDEVADARTLHVFPVQYDRRNRARDVPDTFPRFERPLVLEHEVSGVPFLYFSLMNLDSIVGLDEEESEAVIAELCRVTFAPDNVYIHRWRHGDLVIWDNLTFQHARDDTTAVGPRVLQKAMCAKGLLQEQYSDEVRAHISKQDSRVAQRQGTTVGSGALDEKRDLC